MSLPRSTKSERKLSIELVKLYPGRPEAPMGSWVARVMHTNDKATGFDPSFADCARFVAALIECDRRNRADGICSMTASVMDGSFPEYGSGRIIRKQKDDDSEWIHVLFYEHTFWLYLRICDVQEIWRRIWDCEAKKYSHLKHDPRELARTYLRRALEPGANLDELDRELLIPQPMRRSHGRQSNAA